MNPKITKKELCETIHSLSSSFNHLENRLFRREQDKRSKKKGHFPFIPYDAGMFVEGLSKAVSMFPKEKEYYSRSLRFIDVGCGPGTKVALAQSVADIGPAYGLEYDPTYIPTAKKLCGESRIIQADGTKWKGYKYFDIIYMYWPIINPSLQIKLQEQVRKFMRKGALVLCAGCGYSPNEKRLKLMNPGARGICIYRKI